MKKILSIDPSINNTGYALIEGGRVVRSGVVRSDKERSEPERVCQIAEGVSGIAFTHEPDEAVVEIPGAFSYGRSTAQGKAQNRASMQKLDWAIGAIFHALARAGLKIRSVRADQWKAKRAKKLDQAIASHHVGKKVTTDEADAIMLGIWASMTAERA